jgi:signal transduction histidine kinase
MKYDFPSVKYHEKQILFEDGRFCKLPSEYKKESNKKHLDDFYKKLLDTDSTELVKGEDILGFNFFRIGLICYVGLICECSIRSKGNNLKKKYPSNKFQLDYILNRINEENKLINYQEYIPIDVVAQNLHEIRGLNAKVTDNLDALLQFDNEEKWDEQFESANPYLRKIYVASRLTKFILDNTKFYNPNFWDTLTLNKDRYFNPHRCVSKIVKIYRNDFKKDKPDIEFQGNSIRKLQGDKEYFEILIKIFVENALKYTTIQTIGPKIKILEKNHSVFIEISSYGRLIPIEDKNNIFLKGYRSSVNKLRIDGTGMGLFNAKKLIEKFGGSIELTTKQANSEDKDLALGWNIFTLTFNTTFNADKNAFA